LRGGFTPEGPMDKVKGTLADGHTTGDFGETVLKNKWRAKGEIRASGEKVQPYCRSEKAWGDQGSHITWVKGVGKAISGGV